MVVYLVHVGLAVMHFSVAAFAALLASNTALGAPLVDVAAEVDARAPFGIFSDVTVFVPPRDYIVPRTLYARTALLPNGDLLATWGMWSTTSFVMATD